MRILRSLLAAVMLLCSSTVSAQTFPTIVNGARASGSIPFQCSDTYDNCGPITSANPQLVNQIGISATGPLNALNASVTLPMNGAGGFAVDLRGTFSGTVTFQGTVDGTNWIAIPVFPLGSAAQVASVTTATAAGAWIGNAAGLVSVRARMTAYTSGTATAVVRGAQPVPSMYALPSGGTSVATSLVAGTSVSLNAGTNVVGDVGLQYRADATGAATAQSVISLATTASTQIKSTAGRIVAITLTNNSASLRSVKFFNVATPTMGTTAAAFEIDIPAGQIMRVEIAGGLAFSTAISYSVTAARGLTDNTATGLAASDVTGFVGFR